MNNNNRFRLEFGNTWWSRVLKLMFWVILIATFFGSLSQEDEVNGLALTFAFMAVGVNYLIMFGVWKLLQWVINDKGGASTHSQGPKKSGVLGKVIVAVLVTLFIVGTAMMFIV